MFFQLFRGPFPFRSPFSLSFSPSFRLRSCAHSVRLALLPALLTAGAAVVPGVAHGAVQASVESNVLTITMEDNDTAVVTVSGGNVLINGADPSTGPFQASLVTRLIVNGLANTTLDLSAVTRASFTNLGSNGDAGQFVGGGLNKKLVAPDEPNEYNVTGIAAGSLALGMGTFTFSNVSQLVGSSWYDEARGTNSSYTWDLNGVDTFTVSGITFSQVESISGGNQNDTLQVREGGFLSGTFNGRGGNNTLSYQTYPEGSPVEVNLATRTAPGVHDFVNVTLIIGRSSNTANNTIIGPNTASNWTLSFGYQGAVGVVSYFNFRKIVGGSANDTFIVQSTGNVSDFDGGGGTDTLVVSLGSGVQLDLTGPGSGTYNTSAVFSGMENLTGGAGNDILRVHLGGSLAGIFDGGDSSSNEINFSSISGVPVSVDVAQTSATGVANFTNVARFVGNNYSQSTFRGPDSSASWELIAFRTCTVGGYQAVNFPILQGGSGDDTFTVSSTSTSNFVIRGGTGTDTMNGFPTGITCTLNGPGSGTITGWGSLSFEELENMIGSPANDTLNVTTTGSLISSFDGGAGVNALRYNNGYPTDVPVMVDLVTSSATGVEAFANVTNLFGHSNTSDTLVGFEAPSNWLLSSSGGTVSNIQFNLFRSLQGGSFPDTFTLQSGIFFSLVDGGGGTDTLIGPATVPVRFDMTGSDSGEFRFSSGSPVLFISIENLAGGITSDELRFFPGGSLSGTFDGGGGTNPNTLSYAGYPDTHAVIVNLAAQTAPDLGGWANVTRFVGTGNAASTLIGPDAGTAWTLGNNNSGSLNGGSITFSSFPTVQGGNGNDSFTLTSQFSSGSIVGGGGIDTLTGPPFSIDWTLSGPGSGSFVYFTPSALANTFSGIENLLGATVSPNRFYFTAPGALLTSLTGRSSNDLIAVTYAAPITWHLTGPGTGTFPGVSDPFTGIDALSGGAGNDVFVLHPGGSLSRTADGGEEANSFTCNEAPAVTDAVTVALRTGVPGSSIVLSNVASVAGNGHPDSLFAGSSEGTTWTLSPPALAGTANDVSFTGFAKVSGGSGPDVFHVTLDSSATSVPVTVADTGTDPAVTDTLDVTVAVGPDIEVTSASVTAGSAFVVFNSGLDEVKVTGSPASDAFSVIPSTTAEITVDGAGSDSPAGNSLYVDVLGLPHTNTPDSVTVTGHKTVRFLNFASAVVPATLSNMDLE